MAGKKLAKRSVMMMEFDWILFVTVIILSVFGIVAIYTATRNTGSNSSVIVQSAAFVGGTVLLILTCFFDYEQFQNLVKPIFIFSIATLVIVLIIGTGDTEWGEKLDSFRFYRRSAGGVCKSMFYSDFFISSFKGSGKYKQAACNSRFAAAPMRASRAYSFSAGYGKRDGFCVYVHMPYVCREALI